MLHVEEDSIDMIIDFDRNPALSEEQRLQSLMESVQLALSNIETQIAEIEKKLEQLGA